MRMNCPICRRELRDAQFTENKIIHVEKREHDQLCNLHNLEDLQGFDVSVWEAEMLCYTMSEGVER